MKICFVCKKQISESDKYLNVFTLGKEGIAIPVGMKGKDVICNECYVKEKNQYKQNQRTLYVSPNVRGVEIHDKALTPEEIKAMYERGPPTVDDKTPHIISHKDEKDDYLWIDGKKIKKDNPEDSK